MMGDSHARAGVAAWFTYAGAVTLIPAAAPLRMDVFELLAGAVVAGATSHGWLSPDADGHKWLAKLIPGGHRGPLHMPDLMAAVGAGLLYLAWDSPARSMVAALVVAWLVGHLASDAAFGKVPFLLAGGRRYGLSLETDGWFERVIVRKLLLPVALVAGAASAWMTSGLPVPSRQHVAYVVDHGRDVLR